MPKPLGPTQLMVLDALASWPWDSPATCRELAEFLNIGRLPGHPPKTTAGSVNASLVGLRWRGLADKLGVAANGARCWTITDAGRAVAGGDDPEAPEATGGS